ncbi:MAG: hypothetical protein ACKO6Q_05675 [Bacteroidota bacterium]
MESANSIYKKILAVYTICFLGWVGWVYAAGSLLSQIEPTFLLNRLDLTLNLVLSTGLHGWLTAHPFAFQLMDLLFVTHPIWLWLSVRNEKMSWVAIAVVVLNLTYVLLASSYTILSMNGWIGWYLIPLLFCFRRDQARALALEGMRYAFMIILFSAGLWKIRAGGIFDTETMSGILISQHATEMVYNPDSIHIRAITWLIQHPLLSYSLYLTATLIELSFLAGLFTKKWDRLLCWALIAFILFDILLMRINYSAWLAFIGVIWGAGRFPSDKSWRLTPGTK